MSKNGLSWLHKGRTPPTPVENNGGRDYSYMDGYNSREELASSIELPFGEFINQSVFYLKRQVHTNILIARSLTEHDGYGIRILNLYVTGVLGPGGIGVSFVDKNRKVNTEVTDMFKDWQWSKTYPDYRIDELQRLILKALIRDGESFVQILGSSKSLNLHAIDALNIPQDLGVGMSSPDYTQQGIEYNKDGSPKLYNFRPFSEASFLSSSELESFGKVRTIPAHQMIHTYRVNIPGASRGISWMRGAYETLRDLRIFESQWRHLMDTLVAMPGFFSITPEFQEPAVDPKNSTEVSAKAMMADVMRASPRKRRILPEGIIWNPVELPSELRGDLLRESIKTYIRRISRAVNLAFASVSGELSDSNYSALRQASLENKDFFEITQTYIIGSMRRITREWLDWNEIDPKFPQDLRVEFHPPTVVALDPQKEARAVQIELLSGLTSRASELRKRGVDPETIFAELQYEIEIGLHKTAEEDEEETESDGDKVGEKDTEQGGT